MPVTVSGKSCIVLCMSTPRVAGAMIVDRAAKSARTAKPAVPTSIAFHGASWLSSAAAAEAAHRDRRPVGLDQRSGSHGGVRGGRFGDGIVLTRLSGLLPAGELQRGGRRHGGL